MKYFSVCSGIESASVAWETLGWEPVGFSEIEPFPCEVLKYRFPKVKNYGDMTNYKEWKNVERFDIMVGGTPCQSFSVAGLRKGLDDPRGNLMLTYGAIADHYKPEWIVWENVPGVLSSNKGRDFGTFLGMLGELGYGFAYRVLDAQYFGVPQRRRRVFVVGYRGDWRRAAKVLFESEGLCRYPAPSRKKREDITGTITTGFGSRGVDADQIADGSYVIIAHGQANAEIRKDGISPSLTCNHEAPIVMHETQDPCVGETTPCLTGTDKHTLNTGTTVRRLAPVECERLQGFPDNWTQIPWRGKSEIGCPDGPRYKAIGNSMAVPVVKWIGERING